MFDGSIVSVYLMNTVLLSLICIHSSCFYAKITKIWLFAIDNVELTANVDYLYIYYFCYIYEILLNAISIIAAEATLWKIVKLFFWHNYTRSM